MVGYLCDIECYNMFLPLADISVQVTLSSSISPLPAGLTGFSLRCDVSGTGSLNSPTITYMWQREGIMISDQQGQTLTLLLLLPHMLDITFVRPLLSLLH